jgi:hypothetical protein
MLAVWILLVVAVVALIFVVRLWLSYSNETKEFLRNAQVEKHSLTYEEFLTALRDLPVEWQLVRVFGRYCIRSIPDEKYPLQSSPITAVCRAVGRRFFFVSDLPYFALEAMGLPQGIATKIWQAEDGRDLQDAEVRKIRDDLLKAVRLSDKYADLIPVPQNVA